MPFRRTQYPCSAVAHYTLGGNRITMDWIRWINELLWPTRFWERNSVMKWTKEEEKELRKKIMDYSKHEEITRILFFGGSNGGKSTLCNGIISAVEGRKNVSSYFPCGALTKRFTKNFHVKQLGNIRLIDMAGIHNTKEITDENIRKIASGKTSFSAKINELFEVDYTGKESNRPSDQNDIGCVVLVIRMDVPIPDEIKRLLKCIMELAGEGSIAYRVILTHMDGCGEKYKTGKDLEYLFDSRNVQGEVQRISDQIGVPPNLICVVRNYVHEPETDVFTNILLLRAFEKVVDSALEQTEKKKHN